MDDEELARIDEGLRKIEEEGLQNILKHFDRIHDKSFDFNNILIAGYFTLAQLDKSVPIKSILIPIVNLFFLIYIEYRMMMKSKIEANITKVSKIERDNWGRSITRTNIFSLLIIASTLIVAAVFLYYLF